MTKYLLDYRGGCKGDFLCNFLNFKKLITDGGHARSKKHKINLKNWEGYNVEKKLEKEFFIIPGHRLYGIEKELLEKYNCKIIKISIEKKYYRTASIEGFVKAYTSRPLFFKKKLGSYLMSKTKDNFLSSKIEYHADFYCLEKNLEINDYNRYQSLIYDLENCEKLDFHVYDDVNKDYSTVFKNLSYEDIFINKKYDELYKIQPNFNSVLYEEALEKTWLPDIVNCFGYDIDLTKYGYRDY
jgi:hypothetical protein